jgi:hypothetical protein
MIHQTTLNGDKNSPGQMPLSIPKSCGLGGQAPKLPKQAKMKVGLSPCFSLSDSLSISASGDLSVAALGLPQHHL